MSPERAAWLGVDPDACRIISESRAHGSAWRIEYMGKILTQFSSTGIHAACRWVARLRRCYAETEEQ